jgi:hypothetical protein
MTMVILQIVKLDHAQPQHRTNIAETGASLQNCPSKQQGANTTPQL